MPILHVLPTGIHHVEHDAESDRGERERLGDWRGGRGLDCVGECRPLCGSCDDSVHLDGSWLWDCWYRCA
jgi:hypothetical protein